MCVCVCMYICIGFPHGSAVKNSPARQETEVLSLDQILWRRAWQPTPVFFLGESHGQRSLAGYGPWDCKVGHD